jgi:hypothetical protein
VVNEWMLDSTNEAEGLLEDVSSLANFTSSSSSSSSSYGIRPKPLPAPLTLDDSTTDSSSRSIMPPLLPSGMNRSTSVNNFGYRKSEFNLFGLQDE